MLDEIEEAADAVESGDFAPAVFHRCLSGILSDREVRPLWHPLGFIHLKVPLELRVFRFHLWPPNQRSTQEPTWDCHTHRFVLESVVLHGEIGNEVITVKQTPDGRHSLYEVDYDRNESVLVETTRRAEARPGALQRVFAKDHYAVQRGLFHRSAVPAHTLTATFVVTSDEIQAKPLVLGVPGHGQVSYDRRPVNLAFFRRIAEQVVRGLPRS